MFMDFSEQPPPPRWEPSPRRPPLTPRERRAVTAILLFNVAMLVCGPLAGVTLFQAIPALFR